ncbi:hypothetical protein [Candidatus Regiella endosymbiont of Tuberolachnus salignus]
MTTIIWKRATRPVLDRGNAKYRRHQRRKAAAISRDAMKNSVDRIRNNPAKIAQAQPHAEVNRAIVMATLFPLHKKLPDSLYNRLIPKVWLFSIRETCQRYFRLTTFCYFKMSSFC